MADVLTEIFSLLDLQGARCSRLEAGGEWALRFPAKPALKFAAVLNGGCWMLHPDEGKVWLGQHDVFLLSHTPSYVIASDPELPPEDGVGVLDWGVSDTQAYGGADTVLLAGSFSFDDLYKDFLIDAFPHFLHFPAASHAAATVRHTLEILDAEIRRTEMGSEMLKQHLADMLLIQLMRSFADQSRAESGPMGWVRALANPRIGRALNLMHSDPARSWTVGDLSREVGMSRSSFSDAFTAALGKAPINYLLHWRMRKAQKLIRQGHSIVHVAETVGYGSQSAFGAAFKRIVGRSPKSEGGRVSHRGR